MIRNVIVKTMLLISGLIAAAIGTAIVVAPETFYASYGIVLGGDASLMSEIRAPGGALLGTGLLMLMGVFVRRFAAASLAVAATIYLGYGAARVLSVVLDGVPDSGLVAASGIELTIGFLCLESLLRAKPQTQFA